MNEAMTKERLSRLARVAARVAFSACLWVMVMFALIRGIAHTAPIVLGALLGIAVVFTPGFIEWVTSAPTWLRWVGTAAAWIWALVAGGGGFGLLLTRGPLPLTNGWFALFSGLAACPLTAWLLKRYAGVTLSGRARLAAAVFILLAGRMALLTHWYPLSRP
jgi:hypothetical protein